MLFTGSDGCTLMIVAVFEMFTTGVKSLNTSIDSFVFSAGVDENAPEVTIRV